MTDDLSVGMSELSGPSVIDAHLMSVACEGVAVVLTGAYGRTPGRLDLADGFAEIGFIDQSSGQTKRGALSGMLLAEYYFRGETLFRFETRIVGHTATDRYRLSRPRRVARIERRSSDRLYGPSVVGTSFALDAGGRAHTAEVADLSPGGARLLVDRDVGFERGSKRGDGWLQLSSGVAIPLSFEVRHVQDHDAARIAIGVRFQNVRVADRFHLNSFIAGLAAPSVA